MVGTLSLHEYPELQIDYRRDSWDCNAFRPRPPLLHRAEGWISPCHVRYPNTYTLTITRDIAQKVHHSNRMSHIKPLLNIDCVKRKWPLVFGSVALVGVWYTVSYLVA